MDLFLTNTHEDFQLHKMLTEGLEWCGSLVDYWDVFISCLDSLSDGTHSLQRIHCWASDLILHFSKSRQGWTIPLKTPYRSMKRKTNLIQRNSFHPNKMQYPEPSTHRAALRFSQQLPIKIIEIGLALIWLYNVQLYEDNEEDLSKFMGEGG